MIIIEGIAQISDACDRRTRGSYPPKIQIPSKAKSVWEHWFNTTTGCHVGNFNEVRLFGFPFDIDDTVPPSYVRVLDVTGDSELVQYNIVVRNKRDETEISSE